MVILLRVVNHFSLEESIEVFDTVLSHPKHSLYAGRLQLNNQSCHRSTHKAHTSVERDHLQKLFSFLISECLVLLWHIW